MTNFNESLLISVQNGNQKACDTLYKTMLPYIKGVILNVSGNKNYHEVGELAHEITAHIMRADIINRFIIGQNFKSWIASITKNKYIDYYRHNARHKQVIYNSEMFCQNDGDTDNTQSSIIANHTNGLMSDFNCLKKEQAIILFNTIKNHLNYDMKKVIELWYFEELNQEEIAKITGWSENQVGVLHYRAKQKLKSVLKKSDFFC